VEPGDLNMKQDEVVLVTKKDGDWWTGIIGDRSGVFPSNYVQYLDPQVNFNFFFNLKKCINVMKPLLRQYFDACLKNIFV